MDFRRLKNFITVVETGSIARAAQVLHIAQPALSVQMRQLESLAGCQLLSRSSRGVVPTATGLEFVRRTKEMLKMLEGLRGIGQEQASLPSGHVVIGTAASVAAMIAVPLVNGVREQYPAITLELVESPGAYVGEMLLRGRIDIAIMVGDYSASGMHVQQVATEDLFVLGLPGTAGEVELQQLAGARLIMPARPNSLRTLIDRACVERGVLPNVVTEASSPYTMLQLVRAGVGATVLPLSMLGDTRPTDLPVGRLVNPVLTRAITVATATETPLSPQLIAVKRLLLSILERQAGNSVWEGATRRA
ncbi:LysR substrate-binding domain-containing protein [Ramlibacter rhizophilus]|uniref:LysR family transcriptional regulator n=1 Tax=Ramlibacter rhizophilus TaxID=1781167 RepID=A0A4Z0C4G2_9BURK|nr:LysR substrate-binding domain-containing protein [Ramlibacter rhizophilus]TFZ05019.1 LysR family transcriptional regulator [Ramlibacter rhizophilus]